MIITRHPDRDLDRGPVMIPAFRSLTRSHVDIVAQAVGGVPSEWSLDRHDDYDGYLSVIVSAPGEGSPTFVVSGATDQIELCTLDRDDRMRECGSFTTIEAATAELIGLLTAATT